MKLTKRQNALVESSEQAHSCYPGTAEESANLADFCRRKLREIDEECKSVEKKRRPSVVVLRAMHAARNRHLHVISREANRVWE